MSLGAIRGKQPLPGCDSRDVPWAPASGRDELCFRNANFTAFGIKMWRKAAQVELCALGTAECPLLGPTKALKAFLVQVPALSVPLSAEGDQFCCLTKPPFAARTFPCCSPWICGSTGRAEHGQGRIHGQPLLPVPRPAARCAAQLGQM